MHNTYTDEAFIEAVRTSTSIRQAIKKLGLIAAGAAYRSFHLSVERLNVDISHFTGQASNKGMKFAPKRGIEDYLSNSYPIQSNKLRKRLIREGYKDPICEHCKLSEWLGKPIPLELDHIDGNHENNQLNNLRILCPNCHAQTPTYRGRNQKRKKDLNKSLKKDRNQKRKKALNKSPKKCIDCQKSLSNSKAIRCIKCYSLSTERITWPSDKKLSELVWEKPTTTLAKELGVSDKAIEKRCKSRGISKPPRGYWSKK